MSIAGDRLPVIAAAGQASERFEQVTPLDLAARACEEAFALAPGLRAAVRRVVVINILSGAPPAAASLLAQRLGLSGCQRAEVTTVGGNSPQSEVNRACAEIAAGSAGAVLIVGAEAQRSAREAQRSPQEGSRAHEHSSEPRNDDRLPADPVVGDARPGVGPVELAAGLIAPVHIYALFESVLASKAGRSFEEQRRWLGHLLAPLTVVASRHEHAWFRQARAAEEISTVSADNRLVAEPYTKLMCAFLNVDQAAAVVISSLQEARAAGLSEPLAFVMSGASANDVWFPSERRDPSSSPAIAAAGRSALAEARLDIDEIGLLDLYSCFPCALEMACSALGIDVFDPRGLSVTGGLPYFGGPGNDYTLHAIATVAQRVRSEEAVGLVSGLGWYATKHAIGIYGPEPPAGGFRLADTSAAQAAIDAEAAPLADPVRAEGLGTVVAHTVTYGRDGAPSGAPAIVRLDDGSQLAAAAHPGELAELAGVNLVGEKVVVGPAGTEGGGPGGGFVPEVIWTRH
jgi:acetyl-CoA C-acetyltransferase